MSMNFSNLSKRMFQISAYRTNLNPESTFSIPDTISKKVSSTPISKIVDLDLLSNPNTFPSPLKLTDFVEFKS